MILNHRGEIATYKATPEVQEIASNRIVKALAPYDPGRLEYHYRDPLMRFKGMKIVEEMLEDPQIAACMTVLRWSVISRGYSVQPAENPAGAEHAAFLKSALENIDGTIEDSLGQLTSCTAYGYALAEKVYRSITFGPFAGKWGLKAIKSKKPGAFDFETDEFDNILSIISLQAGPTSAKLPLDKFIVWSWMGEFGNPYGMSALRAAYGPWKRKQMVEKFELVALDRFGMPTVIGKYPDDATQDVQDKLLGIVKSLQSDNAGVMPENLTVELLEAARQGRMEYQGAIAHYNTEIALAILAQSLSTNQNEKVGSMAQAKVHEETMHLVLGTVKRCIEETVLAEQVVRPLIDYNYGPQESYPSVKFGSLQPENEKEIAETCKLLVEGKVNPAVAVAWIKDRINLPEVEGVEMVAPEPPPPPAPVIQPAGPEQSPTPPRGGKFAADFGRQLSPYEERIDFYAVQRDMDGADRDALIAASGIIQDMLRGLRKVIQAKHLFGKGADLDAIAKLQIKGALTGQLRDSLAGSLKIGASHGASMAQQTIIDIAGNDLLALVPKVKAIAAGANGGVIADSSNLSQHLIDYLNTRATLFAGDIKETLLSQVKQALIQAVQQDLSETQAMAKVEAVFNPYVEQGDVTAEELAKAPRLRTIVRTNMTDAYNQGLRHFYETETDGFVVAYQYSAVMDSRTTPFCRAWDKKILKLGDPLIEKVTPPNHYNCRSIWVPLTKLDRFELSKDLPADTPAEGFTAGKGCCDG